MVTTSRCRLSSWWPLPAVEYPLVFIFRCQQYLFPSRCSLLSLYSLPAVGTPYHIYLTSSVVLVKLLKTFLRSFFHSFFLREGGKEGLGGSVASTVQKKRSSPRRTRIAAMSSAAPALSEAESESDQRQAVCV